MSKDQLFPGTHIALSEYRCRCCGALPPDLYAADGELGVEYGILFRAFEEIRAGLGGPISVSGFRCPKRNKAVGGEDMSVHLFGLALDLDLGDEAEVRQAVEIARRLFMAPRIGWKRYLAEGKTLVHIDYGYLIVPRFSPALVRGKEW